MCGPVLVVGAYACLLALGRRVVRGNAVGGPRCETRRTTWWDRRRTSYLSSTRCVTPRWLVKASAGRRGGRAFHTLLTGPPSVDDASHRPASPASTRCMSLSVCVRLINSPNDVSRQCYSSITVYLISSFIHWKILAGVGESERCP